MSYITFDYRCPECNAPDDTRMVRRTEMDEQFCSNPDCTSRLVRLPPGTRTTFRYADSKLKD